jgi:glycosyltransferase involved in cell wall biosynthesis
MLEVPTDIAGRDTIVFSGNLEYHPNVEAVQWFRNEIWPRLREQSKHVTWELVGRNPDAIARLVQGDPRIVMVGPVDDAIATLASTKVCIVPLRSGSGTRFKILEAWAARRAVVSTSLGAEGLAAVDGQHLLIADDPKSFADAVTKLLNDPAMRQRLGEAGRALYEERFTWPAVWKTFKESGGL